MAGKNDWAAFEAALKQSKLTPKALTEELAKLQREAEGLSASATTEFDEASLISTWRQGRKRPRFDQLPLISQALSAGDPTFLARSMGIIPDDNELRARIIHLQTRVDELKLLERKLDLTTADRRNAAVANVVGAAMHTDRWAVAVWPAMEGPAYYPLHVSDRIDFMLVDGVPERTEEQVSALLRQDERIRDALTAAHAVPSPRARPRWADLLRDQPDVPPVVSYSVPLLAASFPPGTNLLRRTPTSIAVVAVSVAAWAVDTAGFIARMLTYGHNSSRGLQTETFGYRSQQHVAPDEHLRRAAIHTAWLQSPPTRYVWSHFGHPANAADLFPHRDTWRGGLTCVWLRETDQLIDATAPPEKRDSYKRTRDNIDAYADSLDHDRLIRLDVDHLNGDPVQNRSLRMEQALLRSVDAIEAMMVRDHLDRVSVQMAVDELRSESRSTLAQTVYRWLRDKNRLVTP